MNYLLQFKKKKLLNFVSRNIIDYIIVTLTVIYYTIYILVNFELVHHYFVHADDIFVLLT